MAVAAFKSTSKRTTAGPQDGTGSATAKGKSDSSSQNGAARRTRSLNNFSDNLYKSTSSEDSSLNGQIEFETRRDNPLFRGSTVLEEASSLLQQNKEDSRVRRGRSLSRHQPIDANNRQYEPGQGSRRGRSVSRHHSTYSQNASNQYTQTNAERRGRSLSRGKYYDSESDMDATYNKIGLGRLKNLGVNESQRHNTTKPTRDQSQRHTPTKPTRDQFLHQQKLRRCSSQLNFSQSLDGYSTSGHPDECVEEKTIKSVYEQIKSLRSDHPTGDMEVSGLHEVVRSEVQCALAEIRSDLEQALARKSLLSTASDGSIKMSQSDDIREEYAVQLEQSERRARDLLAQFTEEEQRCKELSRILKELHADPQLSQTQKLSRIQKKSVEQMEMSKCLTDEAQSYFDEFVSISTLEDSEMSSLEEFENGSATNGSQYTSVPAQTDVVLPWLELETFSNSTSPPNRRKSENVSDANKVKHAVNEARKNSRVEDRKNNKSNNSSCNAKSRNLRNMSNSSPKTVESKTSLSRRNPSDKMKQHGIKKIMKSFGNASQEGSSKSLLVESNSSYQGDEYLFYACNEAALMENLKVKNLIDLGGLLLCNKLQI